MSATFRSYSIYIFNNTYTIAITITITIPSTYVPRMFFMFSMYFLYIYSTEKKDLKKKKILEHGFFLEIWKQDPNRVFITT